MTGARAASPAGVKQCVPLLNIRSMDASLRFYVDGLGFTLTNKWEPDGPGRIRWCMLELDEAGLMLQEIVPGERWPQEFEGRVGKGVGLNYTCSDAIALYHAVQARGITPQRPFVGNRMWVVTLRDPDGYMLYFESETDVPEETEYDG